MDCYCNLSSVFPPIFTGFKDQRHQQICRLLKYRELPPPPVAKGCPGMIPPHQKPL